MTTKTTLMSIINALCAPFPIHCIELKPGPINREKTRALALAYADMRVYQERLDTVAGAENWSNTYTMTTRGIVCTLTVCGVAKSATGDYPSDTSDPNVATSAEAQAFKRACVAFGIGRYLYDLPSLWVPYNADQRQISGDHQRIVTELYRRAGY